MQVPSEIDEIPTLLSPTDTEHATPADAVFDELLDFTGVDVVGQGVLGLLEIVLGDGVEVVAVGLVVAITVSGVLDVVGVVLVICDVWGS